MDALRRAAPSGRYPRRVTSPQRAPGGFPVVGIIGGGQLARMCAGPAAELGDHAQRARRGAGRGCGPGHPVVAGRRPHRRRGRAAPSPGTATSSPSTTSTSPPTCSQPLWPKGSRCTRRPRPCCSPRTSWRCASGSPRSGSPARAWARARTAADVDGLRGTGRAGRSWPRPRAAATTARASASSHSTDELRRLARGAWAATARWPTGSCSRRRSTSSASSPSSIARSPSNQAAAWPVVETVQTDGICTEVLAPAPGPRPDARGRRHRGRAADRRASSASPGCSRSRCSRCADPATGCPAYVVNELAMRPHNSGHWSMDGAVTGQFEQHLRAVLDLPLGAPTPREPHTVMANVLGGDYPELYPRLPPRHGARPGAEGAPLRQGRPPRPQDRARQRLRRRPRASCASAPATPPTTSQE